MRRRLKVDISVYRQPSWAYWNPRLPSRAWSYGVFRKKLFGWELIATFDTIEDAHAFRSQIRQFPLVFDIGERKQ